MCTRASQLANVTPTPMPVSGGNGKRRICIDAAPGPAPFVERAFPLSIRLVNSVNKLVPILPPSTPSLHTQVTQPSSLRGPCFCPIARVIMICVVTYGWCSGFPGSVNAVRALQIPLHHAGLEVAATQTRLPRPLPQDLRTLLGTAFALSLPAVIPSSHAQHKRQGHTARACHLQLARENGVLELTTD